MSKRYKLLKDINSPVGNVKAGVVGKDDGHSRIWFEAQYWNKETCDANPDWFELINDRIEVHIEGNGFAGEMVMVRTLQQKHEIPKDKFPLIKQAIEDVLNNEPVWRKEDFAFVKTVGIQDEYDAPPYYIQQDMEDAFNAGRKKNYLCVRDDFKFKTFKDYLNSLTQQNKDQ